MVVASVKVRSAAVSPSAGTSVVVVVVGGRVVVVVVVVLVVDVDVVVVEEDVVVATAAADFGAEVGSEQAAMTRARMANTAHRLNITSNPGLSRR